MSLTTFNGDLSVIGKLSLSDSGITSILDSTSQSNDLGPIITVGTNEYNHNGIGSIYPLSWTGIMNYSNDSIVIASFGPDTTSGSTINEFQISQNYSTLVSSTANYSVVTQSKETGTANVTQQMIMPDTYTILSSQYVCETVGTMTAMGSSIDVAPAGIQLSCSNGNNLILSQTNLSCNAPLSLDNGKITSDGNGNLGIANNLTLGWGSSLKIPNSDGSKTFTLSNNGTGIVANSDFEANGNIKGGVVLCGAASYSSGVVGGQGSMLAWNLADGDAYSYLVNIIPSSGYSGSGFKFYTTVLGESVSGTPILQVDGSGNVTCKGNIQPSEQIKTANGNHVEFYDSTGNNFIYVFQDSSVNRLRFYAGGSASGDVEFVNNLYGKNVILSGTSSLDNGMITTDGSGKLILQNTNYSTDPQYIQFTTHSPDTNNNYIRMFWQNDDGKDSLGNTLTGSRFHFHNMMYGNSYEMHGTLYVGDIHNSSLIATGSVTCNSISSPTLECGTISTSSECHFANGAFTDPDYGVTRDAKFGRVGIAVIGGTKTDTLTVTGTSSLDGGKITTNGNGKLTSQDIVVSSTMTIPNSTYANITSSPTIGMLTIITNALKPGETSGNGTGCLCVYDGSNWVNVSTGTTVQI